MSLPLYLLEVYRDLIEAVPTIEEQLTSIYWLRQEVPNMSFCLGTGMKELDEFLEDKGEAYVMSTGGLTIRRGNDEPFPVELGLAMLHMTVLDYSARTGVPIKLIDWDDYEYVPGAFAAMFKQKLPDDDRDVKALPVQDKYTLDMITMHRINSGENLPHDELFGRLMGALTMKTTRDFIVHRKSDTYGDAMYGIVSQNDSIEVERAMLEGVPLPGGQKTKPLRLRRCKVETDDDYPVYLMYPAASPGRIPRLNEVVGSLIRAPMDRKLFNNIIDTSVKEEEIGAAGESVSQDIELARGFNWELFVKAMQDCDVEHIQKNNTLAFETYVKPEVTYVYPGPARNKKSSKILGRFARVGQKVTLKQIYDAIISVDSEPKNVPVWWHKIRGHFQSFRDQFVFTNAKQVTIDSNGDIMNQQ